ncbi:S8/S53 family peptidase [Conexibacter sp. CPCC 206217]|uniref:S8/S53 family peptidase n=1 Tax=Conexibacter sp. CPCC 206217 TaxID=3064574 RepID=UPI00272295A0|nr:S8/S53 family peptidase [Conexibacter sp. CPCC 206217]MDO8208944.1 S8/S53 family peptidase [Conexibacter sp. CPCC 206217]
MLVLALLAMGVTTSAAETLSTSQTRDSAAQFLATAPPPPAVGSICLIDTGVDLTPDTSAVHARLSLWDDIVGDTSPTHHGTVVAAMIGAPLNGWGIVGIWPVAGAHIVSIRANTAGGDEFSVSSYYQALQRCDELASFYGIKVVLLALGSEAPLTEEETFALNDRIASVRGHGLNVVAAAGNNNGGALETPAQLPGVLSVGGSAADGTRCAISAAGARLQAPGCGIDALDTASGTPLTFQGTTASAAVAAVAIDALRSWRPELSPDDAEHLLLSTAVPAAGGGRLDVAAAFRAAGLAAVVDSAPPIGSPPPQPPPPDGGLPDLAPPKDRLPRPRVRTRWLARHPSRLEVRLRNLPRAARGVIVVADRRSRGRRQRLHRIVRKQTGTRLNRITVRSRRPLRLTISFVDPSHKRLDSRPLVVRIGAARKGSR